MTVCQTFLEQSLAHFSNNLKACISASLINKPVSSRLEANRRQGAAYHVELKAIVLLHQTQHKHAETCNNRTSNA